MRIDGWRGSLAVVTVALALAGAAGDARAQAGKDATKLATQAEKDAMAGRLDVAIKGYRKAWEAGHDPAYLFNISVIYLEGVKDPLQAWEYAQQYVAAAKSDAAKREGAQLIAKAEEALAPAFGKVTVHVTPATASVYLDQKLAENRLQRSIAWVEPGEHVVLAEATGREPDEARFSVKAGGRVEVALDLKAQQATLRVETRTPGAVVFLDGVKAGPAPIEKRVEAGVHVVRTEANGFTTLERRETLGAGSTLVVQADLLPVVAAMAPAGPLAGPPAARSAGMSGQRIGAWVCMGTGIAAAIVGTGLYGGAYAAYKGAGDLDPKDYATPGKYQNAFDERTSRGKTLAYSSYAMWGLGAAALGTGLILYFTDPSGPATAVVPAGPGGPGMTASISW